MKNKIKKMKKITLIITILILSVIFLSGTFARYASTASGTSSTMVAEWSFEVNGKNIAVLGDDEKIDFNLFDTIYDSDGIEEETDVKEGLIAPGTSGSFEFFLQNTAEVTTSYLIELDVDNTNIPLEFAIDESAWISDTTELYSTGVLSVNQNKNVIVKWQWPYAEDEITDVSLGGQTVQVSATIKAIQGGNAAVVYKEVPVFPTITQEFSKDKIATGTSFKYNYAPFTYENLDLYSGKTISKIGIPLKKVTTLAEKQYFTLYTVKKAPLANKQKTTVTNEYKIEIPLDDYTSETINDWVYIDLRKYNIKVAEDETLAFSSQEDTIELSFNNATPWYSSAYKFINSILKSYEVSGSETIFFDVYYLEANIVESDKKVEKQLFTGINDKLTSQAFSTLATVNNQSAPFAYNDVDLFSGKTLSKIGIPVKTVAAIDENQTFTLYVIDKEKFRNNQASTIKATYELKLPKSQLGDSTTVNKWIYVDLTKYNITVGEDETLAFAGTNDTVKWAYANAQMTSYLFGSQYNFATKVLYAPNKLNNEAIYFDIYYLEDAKESNEPKQIFKSVLSDVPDSKISTLSDWSFSSAPFSYANTWLFENKTITKIGLPIKKVSAIDDNQTFTVYVVKKSDIQNKIATTPLRTYTLKFKGSDFGTNATAVNKWVYTNTNIVLGENETLAFGSTTDTVIPGYGGNIIASDDYGFWSGVDNTYGDNTSKEIFFDIYAKNNDTSNNEIQAVLTGKNFSILGDSISTFKGYSNDATTTNSTIGSNATYYNGSNIITDVNDTWWKRTANITGMNVLVDNAWSGDTIASRGKTRAMQLHDDTGDNAGTNPDIIAVYLGINDIKNGATVADFTTNYNQMVSNIRTTYPNADVFLLTHIPYSYSSASRPTITDELLEEFNAVIRNVVSANEKCYLVDLYNDSGITQANHKTYMGDEGLHPNASGMSKISDTLINALKSKYLG